MLQCKREKKEQKQQDQYVLHAMKNLLATIHRNCTMNWMVWADGLSSLSLSLSSLYRHAAAVYYRITSVVKWWNASSVTFIKIKFLPPPLTFIAMKGIKVLPSFLPFLLLPRSVKVDTIITQQWKTFLLRLKIHSNFVLSLILIILTRNEVMSEQRWYFDNCRK